MKQISIVVLVGILSTTNTFAVPARVNQTPNGDSFSCLLCHFSSSGGAVNSFGFQVRASLIEGRVDWETVCPLDADQDGSTNGEELGDPTCEWPSAGLELDDSPTRPFDPTSYPGAPMMMDMDPPIEDEGPPLEEDMGLDQGPPQDMDPYERYEETWDDLDAFTTNEEYHPPEEGGSVQSDLIAGNENGGVESDVHEGSGISGGMIAGTAPVEMDSSADMAMNSSSNSADSMNEEETSNASGMSNALGMPSDSSIQQPASQQAKNEPKSSARTLSSGCQSMHYSFASQCLIFGLIYSLLIILRGHYSSRRM